MSGRRLCHTPLLFTLSKANNLPRLERFAIRDTGTGKATSLIKIGHLLPIVIIKALPNYDSYLVMVPDTEYMAILPKKFSSMPWRIGDATVGCVHMMSENHIVLSQATAIFYRKLLDMLLSPIAEQGIHGKRAATVSGAGFVKVSIVAESDTVNPIPMALPYLKGAKQYTAKTITLVPYSTDMKEYIKAALAPAPSEMIEEVIYSQTMREAIVYIADSSYLGMFYGKGGVNVATAAKLTGVRINLKAARNARNYCVPEY